MTWDLDRDDTGLDGQKPMAFTVAIEQALQDTTSETTRKRSVGITPSNPPPEALDPAKMLKPPPGNPFQP
jgi:hypothetical protein